MQTPDRKAAEAAVKVLLQYLGENPKREGLKDTPSRVIKSYDELFLGYKEEPAEILNKKFHDISNYNDIVLMRDINFTSFCEHHMLPFKGKVDIAYIPNGSVIGISKLARLVNVYARRLQIQEKMTVEVAESLQKYLVPKGVAIRISAEHSCMVKRGVKKEAPVLETLHFTGDFKEESKRLEFCNML